MAISNLINRIKEDSEKEITEILDKASKEKQHIIDKKVNDANFERDQILERAGKDAKTRAERIFSSAELKVRNNILSAKQEAITRTFEKALEVLNHLSPAEVMDFIKSAILNTSFQGECVVLISQDIKEKMRPDFIMEVNDALKKAGHQGSVSLSSTLKPGQGIIIISQNGIEVNYSFQTLIASLKEEMEYEITKILFE